jgi:hypothetical protein
MITRHDQDMLRALQLIGRELKRANDLKEKEMEEARAVEREHWIDEESDKKRFSLNQELPETD